MTRPDQRSRCVLGLLAASALGLMGCSADATDDPLDPAMGGTSPAGAGSPTSAGTVGVAGTAGTGVTGGGSSGGSAGSPGAGAGGSSAGSGGAGGGAMAGAAGKGGGAGSAGMPGAGGAPNLSSCKATMIPAPPSEMKETIDITWKEMSGGFSGQQGARGSGRTMAGYPSWAMDHLMWSGGEINFCVRWDSTQPVSETLRDQIEDTLSKGVNAWFSALAGYDCFPYQTIDVKVTGWAVSDRSRLMWQDDSIVPIYTNEMQEGAPTCAASCSRFAHQDPKYPFASCAAGPDKRFDQFVWLEEGYNAPNGWDMGSHLNQADFASAAAGNRLYHIWLHEFGHGVGFPDYYDWDVWSPNVEAPRCVMNAGAASTVTDWDKWMLKRTWSEQLRKGRWD